MREHTHDNSGPSESSPDTPLKKNRDAPNKRSNYIANVVFNTIFLIIVNKVPDWNIIFITDQFPAVLWAINLALGVQISVNFMLIFYYPLHLHHISQTIIAVFQLISIFMIVTVFPFDFSFIGEWFSVLLKIVLAIALIATFITGIVQLLKFFKSFRIANDSIE